MSLYDTLGVAQDASAAAIKAAFRSLAQKNHPDKGGSEALMKQIQAAYDVLGDAERRARYDDVGEETQQLSVRDQAITLLADYVEQLFQHLDKTGKDADHTDVLKLLREEFRQQLENAAGVQRKVAKSITQRTKALKRLTWKQADDFDVMATLLNGQISRLHEKMSKNEAQIDVMRVALTMLADYDYQAEPPAPRPETWEDTFITFR